MNKDIERRDKILFGRYDPDKYFGGVRYFRARVDVIKELLEKDFANPHERDDDAPSIKEFVEIAETCDKADVVFEGYAVESNRDDYRITIDGVNVTIPDTEYRKITYMVVTCRDADEFIFVHQNNGTYFMRAWWE